MVSAHKAVCKDDCGECRGGYLESDVGSMQRRECSSIISEGGSVASGASAKKEAGVRTVRFEGPSGWGCGTVREIERV